MDKDKRDLDKEQIDNNIGMTCEPTNDLKNYQDNEIFSKLAKDGTTVDLGTDKRRKNDPKLENTATDIYYKTQCKIPDSKVSVPTFDSVIEAKEWVDDENKM